MKDQVKFRIQTTNKRHELNTAEVIDKTCEKIAPFWSLENYVAVNPFMGLSHMHFRDAASLLSKQASVSTTMPLQYYIDQYHKGHISKANIKQVLQKHTSAQEVKVSDFINKLYENETKDNETVKLVSDVAAEFTGENYNELFIDRVSTWAAVFFDKGQVNWKPANIEKSLYANWKEYAAIDATPEIHGLKGLRKFFNELPDNYNEAISYCIKMLQLPTENTGHYLHTLFLRIGGWSSYVAGIDWDARLYGGYSNNLKEFLAVLLSWEAAMLKIMKVRNADIHWHKAKRYLVGLMHPGNSSKALEKRLIMHEAFNLAHEQKFIGQINSGNKELPSTITQKPLVQAVFCIDVRSEVFRRNFEMVSDKVETLGFAGFFGFPISYVPLGHNKSNNQCPALVPASIKIKEVVGNSHMHAKAVKQKSIHHHLRKYWKTFKQGAISCFSFVSPLGIAYLPKLFTDTFGLSRPVPRPGKLGIPKKLANNLTLSIDALEQDGAGFGMSLSEQVDKARAALEAMSLRSNFARFVLIAGHRATTVNNPHASGLDCGACGGNSGESNARVAAAVLNKSMVREALKEKGIIIPADTLFLAGLHDTTTDELTILNPEVVPESHTYEFGQLKKWLVNAGCAARTERAARFYLNPGNKGSKALLARSRDWSQVRPEWGLAGCDAFIVAPRKHSSQIHFQGKTFLHSYNWKSDKAFAVLENIMTSPMVVTSWINLQYFASTVDNTHFGAGNKTLHNVTSGLGVLEGSTGDLRIGLPWQSVHDGRQLQHTPHRLNVVIEAPAEAMNRILMKHPHIKNLCDNDWISLFAMNDKGLVHQQYKGELIWEQLLKEKVPVENEMVYKP